MAFKSLLKDAKGPKSKGMKASYLTEFSKLYDEEYSKLGLPYKMDGTNLSQIIAYSVTSMKTAIENNIKLNFLNLYLYGKGY